MLNTTHHNRPTRANGGKATQEAALNIVLLNLAQALLLPDATDVRNSAGVARSVVAYQQANGWLDGDDADEVLAAIDRDLARYLA